MPDNQYEGMVDEIMESVHAGSSSAPASDSEVDAILAGLGMATKAEPVVPQPVKEAAPAPAPAAEPVPAAKPQVKAVPPVAARPEPKAAEPEPKAAEPAAEPEPAEEAPQSEDAQKFNQFFNDHAAVIPDEQPKKPGLFARLFGRKPKEEPEDEELPYEEPAEEPAEEQAHEAVEPAGAEAAEAPAQPEPEVQPVRPAPAPLVIEKAEPAEVPAPAAPEPAPVQQAEAVPQPEPVAAAPAAAEPVPGRKPVLSNTEAFAPITPASQAQQAAVPDSTAEIRMDAPATQNNSNTIDISDALGSFLGKSAEAPKADPAASTGITAQFTPPQPGVQVGAVSDNTAILMPGITNELAKKKIEAAAPAAPQPEAENGDETGQIDLAMLAEQDKDEEPTRELGTAAEPAEAEPEKEPEEDFETEQGSVPLGRIELETVGDVPEVKKQLEKGVQKAIAAVIGCGVIGIVMLVMGTMASGGLPEAINPSVNPIAFAVVQLVLLLAAVAICYEGVAESFSALVGGKPSAYMLPVLAAAACALQCAVVAALPGTYDPNTDTLFAPVAALLLCAARIGTLMEAIVVKDNFAIVSSGGRHSAAMRLNNIDLTQLLAEGLSEQQPTLLVSRPADLVKGFIRKSGIRPRSLAKYCRAAMLCAVVAVVCAAVAWVRGSGLVGAFGVAAAILCLAAPACSTIHSAVCLLMQQRRSAKVGAVVPGWGAVEELGRVNTVVVEAADIFPAGSVLLQGIKTFEKERIDLAILYAASILAAGCDTLRPVFMNIVQNKADMLYEVENLVNEKGRGFTGWIKGSRVIVGNRNMMTAHDIDIPSMDYENRYTRGDGCPIYLAVSGKLFGMFVVRYCANRETASVIHTLQQKGFSMLVRSDDFNVTGRLVEKAYGLADNTVKVLTAYESDRLAEETGFVSESEGCMLHLGSFASFAGGMQAASAAAAAQRSAATVLLACVATGVVIGALLSLAGGLLTLSLPAMVLYQLAWCVPVLALPLTRRY